VPLVLDPASPLPFGRLAGVSHDVQIAVWADGRLSARIDGPMLWTHFGVSGPAALDASRHWTRGVADGRPVRLRLSCCPGEAFDAVDARLRDAIAGRPRAMLGTLLAAIVPASVADGLVSASGLEPAAAAGTLTREDRRRVAHLLSDWELPVTGTRGYNYAEVTAGGVALAEVDPRSMASRRCPGLHLVGEIVDVDGRLGGFNFQWAWASGFAAGRALARESL
jgi:predicted Rossmann fold flavoprotein